MRHKNHPKTKTFRCSKKLHDALEALSAQEERPSADLIRKAVDEFLTRSSITFPTVKELPHEQR